MFKLKILNTRHIKRNFNWNTWSTNLWIHFQSKSDQQSRDAGNWKRKI